MVNNQTSFKESVIIAEKNKKLFFREKKGASLVNKDLTRVISAIVMIGLVVGLVMLGSTASFFMLTIVGALVLDELVVNFFKHSRFGINYLVSQLIYLVPLFGSYFYLDAKTFNQLVVHLTMLTYRLLVYLFLSTSISYKITDSLKKFPYFVGFYISLNIFL